MLISPKRDEGLKRYESEVANTELTKLFGVNEKELQSSEQQLNDVYKQISLKNDSCRRMCKGLLNKLENKTKQLKNERRLKGSTMKGDYMVVNENGYQHLIDQVYTFMKYGPKEYELMREETAKQLLQG
jgi:hypothetical protein